MAYCTNTVTVLYCKIPYRYIPSQYTVLVLLDLTAAFDTVDHVIMIQCLQNDFGISGTVLEWFSSYFNGRTFSVLANNYQSESKTLSCGVPQGSVLGPILFLLYLFPLGRLISLFGNCILPLLCWWYPAILFLSWVGDWGASWFIKLCRFHRKMVN